MAKEYIPREAVLGFKYGGVVDVVDVKNIPAADVVEVVHGRWIKLDVHKGVEQFKCSICRSECYVPTCMGEPMYAFCPNCGNPMDGEDGDSDGTA